ncbi:MAG TPA: SLC45 family MFS transporter [Dehalococcoidia bacterium]|nr:SLC45 family MFS transporter [Dehalococcoidia bacterium]
MENHTGNNNAVPASPGFAPIDYVKVTILGFGLSALWASLHTVVLQLRLLDFVPESQKNSYLGYLTFAGLVLAMVVQPIVGAISDRSRFSWGRRRPFILVGSLALLLFLPGIGLWESYAAVFVCYCLMQVSSNTAQGPYQGFIPDLVPTEKRGLASGVKSLLEMVGGVSLARLAAYFMDQYTPGEGGYWLWLTLGTLGTVFLITALVTLITVREQPGTGRRVVVSPTAREGAKSGGSLATLLVNLLKRFLTYVKQHRSFIWFLVSRGLLGIPGVILQTFALYYLTDVTGVENPASAATNLLIVVGAALIAVVYFAGRLSDRIGRKPIIITAGLVGAAGIVLLYLSDSYTQVLISGAFIGLASGACLSTSWAMATDLAVEGEEAKYLGLTNLAMAAGSALARLIGPVIDFFNNNVEPNMGYSVMLLACLLCFIVGSLLVLKVREVR